MRNGYQPTSAIEILPEPPKSGSNAVKEPTKIEVEIKDWVNLHKEHAQEIIKVSEEEYGKGYFDGVKKAVTLLYNNLFSKENTDNYDFEAWGIVHIYEDDFKVCKARGYTLNYRGGAL